MSDKQADQTNEQIRFRIQRANKLKAEIDATRESESKRQPQPKPKRQPQPKPESKLETEEHACTRLHDIVYVRIPGSGWEGPII